MADITKTIIHGTGATSTHWDVADIVVTLNGFTSETANADGKSPLDSKTVILTSSDVKTKVLSELITADGSPFKDGTTE
tara:strand:- start:244 stop:480 length:237 start_codon:yes stop_codon:yes gene_type:complete